MEATAWFGHIHNLHLIIIIIKDTVCIWIWFS